MRILALVVVCTVSGAGCTGDPDGIADEVGHVYAAFGTGHSDVDDAGENLALPLGLVIDPATGIAYVNDFNHYQIRAFYPDGSIRRIAGTGELGTPTDGPAVEADLSHLGDLLLDGAGTLYVAGWHNSYVLRVDLATGELTRIAGQGTRTKYSGDGGPALAAHLSLPASLALIPDGRLLVTDQENQVVRAIDPATGLIDRFAGRCVIEPELGESCVTPVACPGSEKLACDLSKCSYPCTGAFADAATPDAARFAFPYGAAVVPAGRLAVAPDGTVHVADGYNKRIRSIRTDGSVGTLTEAIENPDDIEIASDGTLYTVDAYAGCVHRFDLDGTVSTIAGICGERGDLGDNGLATKALFNRPFGLALDEAHHRLYIADTSNNRIRYVVLAP
jgi:sugar lactone lactonase YvrE